MTPTPPVPARKPYEIEKHGDRRVDEYYWLRDRQDAGVIAHLEAENAYAAAVMRHTDALKKILYDEMVGRIQETDLSVPVREGGYLHFVRTEAGKQYVRRCRRPDRDGAEEEVVLDENELAAGQAYFRLGVYRISPDQRRLAYAFDTDGDEKYTLRFRDLASGRDFDETIEGTSTSLAWASDSRTVFYVVLDATSRPYRLYRHRVGDAPSRDVLVLEEPDERFFVGVGRTRSGTFVVVDVGSRITSEIRVIPADDPVREPRVVVPRQQGVEAEIEHHGDRFFVLTNEHAVNFKLMEAPVEGAPKEGWRELIPHREDVMLTGVDAFADHLVIRERVGGLPQLRVRRLSTGEEHHVTFPERAYTVEIEGNREFDVAELRFRYSSLITPDSVFDYDMNTRVRELRKQTPVLGGYDPGDYVCERLFATAKDGTHIPISLVHRKDRARDGRGPMFLQGYGAYGINFEPRFASMRISLLDRGFALALAHVRGGGEMGRGWYHSGKFEHKSNSFGDFIAVAEHLIAEGYTCPERLAIGGGSAGGLLMGAVVNERPDLFAAVLAQVPFVDIVTTMLDESLPLTVIEYEEWGNPSDPTVYERMKTYSPYDNVRSHTYPNMLVTTGLNDPRVGFWEPAKWVARLRERTQGSPTILLKVNLGAGHGGASGRYDFLEERSFEYAFLVDRVGGPSAGGRSEA